MRTRDLGEMTWKDFMATDPDFSLGDVFIFRSKGNDYDGYAVAVYESYNDPTRVGSAAVGANICRKGIFWNHKQAMTFVEKALLWMPPCNGDGTPLCLGCNPLLEACKSALKIAEDPEFYPPKEAIEMKAKLITELVSAMRKAGLIYSEMTKK